jgi:hypothetical protein
MATRQDPPLDAPTRADEAQMTPREALRTYLERCDRAARQGGLAPGYRYPCYESLVLEIGRPMEASLLPAVVGRGPLGYCYDNTLQLVRALPGLRYVEGFALPAESPLPCYHAWAIDPASGEVWDRTWPRPERAAYYGIVFEPREVERFDGLGDDYLGILESEYLLGRPLLRTGRLFGGTGPAPAGLARREIPRPEHVSIGDKGGADTRCTGCGRALAALAGEATEGWLERVRAFVTGHLDCGRTARPGRRS